MNKRTLGHLLNSSSLPFNRYLTSSHTIHACTTARHLWFNLCLAIFSLAYYLGLFSRIAQYYPVCYWQTRAILPDTFRAQFPRMTSSAFPVAPSPSFTEISQKSRTIYLSNTISSLIGCIIPIIAFIYLSALSLAYRYAQRNPRPLNKSSGVRVQRYAPIVYVFVVCSSLVEIALASWLLLQYRFHHNFPNTKGRTGTILLLFSASWTAVTAGAYSILFVHPTWSRHPVSSVGAQAIWVFVTLVLWIVGAGFLNGAVPLVLVKGQCSGIVYCGQIQSLFAVSIIEALTLTAGMAVLMWLAWQTTRDLLKRDVEAPSGDIDLPRRARMPGSFESSR